MRRIIELKTPLENPLSEINQGQLKSLDQQEFFPGNESLVGQNLGVVFWLDENNLVAGANAFDEKVHLAFWYISDDRTKLTYDHIECL